MIKEITSKKEKVHQSIVDKFGTMSRFARLAKIDRYQLQKLFARQQDDTLELAKISVLVKTTPLKPSEGEITARQIKALHKALNESGGVVAFCRANEEFPEQSVFGILAGKRVRITPKVRKLLDHFGLK